MKLIAVFLILFSLQAQVITSGGGNGSGGGGGSGITIVEVPTSEISAGTGLSLAGTEMSVDSTVVPTYLTGTASLSFPSTTANRCNALTFTLTGAIQGDSMAPGWPYTLQAEWMGLMRVSSADTVEVRLCNFTGGTATPTAGQTFRATIVKGF